MHACDNTRLSLLYVDSGPDSSGEPSQSGSSSGESPQGGTSSKGRKKRDAPDGPGEIDPTREAENEFVTSYMTLPSSVRQEIGHNFSSFIQSCTFEGNNCLNESWFFISKSASYGNCFSFNYGHNENDPYAGTRLTALTGSLFGLSLVLNLEQRYYIGDGVTKSAGARIALHSPKVNPLVGETGKDDYFRLIHFRLISLGLYQNILLHNYR